MDSITKSLMIGIAVVFDTIEIILTLLAVGVVVNRILTVIEYLVFGTWFWFLGVKFSGKTKNSDHLWLTLVTEMIPVIGALPGLTFGVVMTIRGFEEGKEGDVNVKRGVDVSKETKKINEKPNVTRAKRNTTGEASFETDRKSNNDLITRKKKG